VDSSADNDDDVDNNDDDRRAFQDINRGWPVEAHYMPIRRDARNLSIMQQPLPMKKMIRAAVNQVTELFYLILHTLLPNSWSSTLSIVMFLSSVPSASSTLKSPKGLKQMMS